jgi:excisionase family DNA binding protein
LFRDVELGRGERIRTSDILLPKSETQITTRGNGSQPIGIIPDFAHPSSDGLQQKAAICKDFAPILLPTKSPSRGAKAGGRERLLSVAEVARRLGVCGATVYKLCARGHLDHVRVLNAIRVPPAVLDEFIGSRPRRRNGGSSEDDRAPAE